MVPRCAGWTALRAVVSVRGAVCTGGNIFPPAAGLSVHVPCACFSTVRMSRFACPTVSVWLRRRFGGPRVRDSSSTYRHKVGDPTGNGPPQAPPEAGKFSIAGSPRALERGAPAHAAIQPLSAPRSRRRGPKCGCATHRRWPARLGAPTSWEPGERGTQGRGDACKKGILPK